MAWDSWYQSDMDWKWNLSSLWHHVTRPFHNFIHWVIKSYQYSKVLWNDYEFDYSSILRLLQYKISRTRKCIRKNNIILRSEEVCAQMLHAEELIRKIREDDFLAELDDAHEEKWGPIIQMFSEEKTKQGYSTLDIVRAKTNTEALKRQERQEQHEIYELKSKAEKECWDELFTHLRKHMREWWD